MLKKIEKMKKIFYVVLISMIALQVNAQFGKLIKDVGIRAGTKFGEKIGNHLADKAAEGLADKLISKWNAAEEEALKKDYDSIAKQNPDKYKDYDDYKKSLNKNPNIQDEYVFDVSLDVEKIDKDSKDMTQMYFSNNSDLFAIGEEKEGKKGITVFDHTKNMMVIFSQEGNKKSMQAIPSFQRLGSALTDVAIKSAAYDTDFKLKKTGKTRTIAGYKCDEYSGTYEDKTTTLYLARDLKLTTNNNYGKFLIGSYLINNFSDETNAEGVIMLSQTKDKAGKVSSNWEVKKVSKKTFKLKTADYQ